MGIPFNISTTTALTMIFWACGIVLAVLLTVLIARAVIRSAVLSALRQHSREQAGAVHTVRLEAQRVPAKPDVYPFPPGMAAYSAAAQPPVAGPPAAGSVSEPTQEPQTTALDTAPETVAFVPDEKPDDA